MVANVALPPLLCAPWLAGTQSWCRVWEGGLIQVPLRSPRARIVNSTHSAMVPIVLRCSPWPSFLLVKFCENEKLNIEKSKMTFYGLGVELFIGNFVSSQNGDHP